MAGTGKYPSVAASVVVMIITVGTGAAAEESAMASSTSPTLEAAAASIPVVPTVFVVVILLLSVFFACRSLRNILRLLFGSFFMNVGRGDYYFLSRTFCGQSYSSGISDYGYGFCGDYMNSDPEESQRIWY